MTVLPIVLLTVPITGSGTLSADERVRPRALALSPDKTRLATANRIAGTVSLLSVPDLKLETTLEVGQEPQDLLWLSDSLLVVSLHRERCLKYFSRQNQEWKLLRTVSLTGCPCQLSYLPQTGKLLVTQQHPDALLVLDPASGRQEQSWTTGNLPRFLKVAADESWVGVTCELPGSLWCYELPSGKLLSRQEIYDNAFNLGQPELIAPGELVIPATIDRDFPVDEGNIARGWVVNNRLIRLQVPRGPEIEQRQMGLDTRGHGAADLTGAFLDASRHQLIVLASGVHEVLLLDLARIHWPTGYPEDFAPQHLQEKPGIYRRIPVGGRPIDLVFLNSQEVLLANELDDSVQKLELNFTQVTASTRLSASTHESLLAEGERIFYDGQRSRDGWMSCHTCHYDGHTSGQMFDTLNDRTYHTKKLTLSLHNVSETEPWTWHGWQPDLTESMEKSLRDSMYGRLPITRHAVNALTSYMETLRPIPPASQPEEAADKAAVEAGQRLFFGKAGCSSCHEPPLFTSGLRVAISRVSSDSIYDVLNPPSLLGVASRRRFLHQGQARSLDDVLKLYHRPENTSGAFLNEVERTQLIAYLKQL